VIPAEEISLLRQWAGRLELIEFDDVHASPAHIPVAGPWMVRSLLRMDRSRPVQRKLLGATLPALRAATALRAERGARGSASAAQPASPTDQAAGGAARVPSSRKGS
jgi:hypothetical protein